MAGSDTFLSSLKKEVKEWLASQGMKQVKLAEIMQLTPSAVSNNLHPGLPMSEGFVERLSQTVPRFSNALNDLYAIKSGTPLAQEARDSAEAQKAKAEKIQELRAWEEESVKKIRSLFSELIEDLESKD